MLKVLAREAKNIYMALYPAPKLIEEKISSVDIDIKGVYLIATMNGLFCLKKEGLFKMLEGNFFGITYNNDSAYIFQIMKRFGRILTCKINDGNLNGKLDVFFNSLANLWHQIDVHEGNLYICDTYENKIIKMDIGNKRNECFYPLGKLSNGRRSDNYGHMNSILVRDNDIYIVCHNESIKTGKPSQLIKVDHDFKLCDIRELGAESAHNFVPIDNGRGLCCDSRNCRVKLNDKVILEGEYFTRGISVTDEYIIVGGSEFSKREQRVTAKGRLYILDRNSFELIAEMEVPSIVHEVRCCNMQDLSLSAFNSFSVK